MIKQYRLLGADGPIAAQYKRLYAESIDAAREFLFMDVTVVPDRDLMVSWQADSGELMVADNRQAGIRAAYVYGCLVAY